MITSNEGGFEIIARDGVTRNEIKSFSEAIAYARANKYLVWDKDIRHIVYNGDTDEFIRREDE